MDMKESLTLIKCHSTLQDNDVMVGFYFSAEAVPILEKQSE